MKQIFKDGVHISSWLMDALSTGKALSEEQTTLLAAA